MYFEAKYKGIFLSPFKGLQCPFVKKNLLLKTSSPFLPSYSLVLEMFFFAPKKTDWPLLHMPEKNSFPQSRYSVVTQ